MTINLIYRVIKTTKNKDNTCTNKCVGRSIYHPDAYCMLKQRESNNIDPNITHCIEVVNSKDYVKEAAFDYLNDTMYSKKEDNN